MAHHPAATTFWILDQNAIIMNPTLSLESHVLAPRRLDSIMLRGVPVVPPDSVIETYRHVPAERVQFVITQSADGLSPASMIVKRGAWAEYLLDAWFDPIFRYYGFQKAEQHALEHIVQWHPTILTKMAVVQKNVLNSAPAGYKSGDFVVHLSACDGADAVSAGCEAEFEAFWEVRSVLP
jgi:mannan polymerase II complex MNN11 subunit